MKRTSSFWENLSHDLGFGLWAFLVAIRVLFTGRIPEDLAKDLQHSRAPKF